MQAVSCLSGDNQGHCCRELTSAVAEEVLGSWYSLVESRVLCVSDRHKHPRMPDDTAECPRGCRGLSSQALAGLASLLSVYPLSFPVFTPLLTGTSHQPPATSHTLATCTISNDRIEQRRWWLPLPRKASGRASVSCKFAFPSSSWELSPPD